MKVYAQDKSETFTARNSVFVELGGNAGRYAVNYGYLFYQKGYFKAFGSAGISVFHHPVGASTYWLPALPLEISALLGKANHHLEIGMGITPYLDPTIKSDPGIWELYRDSNHLSAFSSLRLGYRYQKPDGGFFFRVGYTPFFQLPIGQRENLSFQPFHAGLGLGMSF